MHFYHFIVMVLFIDCQVAGISGDMILSSLVDLGANKSKIIDGVKESANLLPGSTIKKFDFIKVKKNDVRNRNHVFLIKKHLKGLLGISFTPIYGTLSRNVTLQSNPVQQPAVAMIIIKRVMLNTAIVPKCNVTNLPSQTTLKLR